MHTDSCFQEWKLEFIKIFNDKPLLISADRSLLPYCTVILSPAFNTVVTPVYQVNLMFFFGSETLKKGPKYGLQKRQSHCCSKRAEAVWSLLLLNNNDPVFCTLLFASDILDRVCSGSQTNPCFQNKNSGCRLTGQL